MMMQTDPNQIRFIPGQMVSFISTRGFALGSTGYQVMPEMEVKFDGTNVEVGGQRFVLPTLRGAIKLKWLVPLEGYDPNAPIEANPSANIQVRTANDLTPRLRQLILHQPLLQAKLLHLLLQQHVERLGFAALFLLGDQPPLKEESLSLAWRHQPAL